LTGPIEDWDDIAAVEVAGTGYARGALSPMNVDPAEGVDPIYRRNVTPVAFTNTGADDWPPVTHVAVIGDGDDVNAFRELRAPFVLGEVNRCCHGWFLSGGSEGALAGSGFSHLTLI
jgi:hypothetical protein